MGSLAATRSWASEGFESYLTNFKVGNKYASNKERQVILYYWAWSIFEIGTKQPLTGLRAFDPCLRVRGVWYGDKSCHDPVLSETWYTEFKTPDDKMHKLVDDEKNFWPRSYLFRLQNLIDFLLVLTLRFMALVNFFSCFQDQYLST